ncbi:Hypothetical_protein [Hexamita inflata]|uniref:Hypothetical_protein n=1 Tax=Hexamita inflata TaxID=28002 RepID=A0ABP1I8C4_9EUKA
MYVRRTSAVKATNDSGTSIQGRNAAASCKPIYTGIHLRRTICVSKEAMERLPLSNPEGSLMAAQHFEPGDFTFRNRFSRAASQEVGCGEEREAQPYEPIIDHTKQSWYFSNASSALTLAAELNRLIWFLIIYIYIHYYKPILNVNTKLTHKYNLTLNITQFIQFNNKKVSQTNNQHCLQQLLLL